MTVTVTFDQILEDESSQLISSMDDYVKACGADLVVLATRVLSSRVLETSHVLGSVTLAAIKRITVPLLVINVNSAAAIASFKGRSYFPLSIIYTNGF